jgi:hypothetical protein
MLTLARYTVKNAPGGQHSGPITVGHPVYRPAAVIIKAPSAAPIGGPVHVTDALFCLKWR